MSIGALEGFTVAVTADRRHDEQIELLERLGARVLHGPTIRTLPLAEDDQLMVATEQVIADPPDVAVFITALGVRSWLAAAESHGCGEELLEALSRAHIIARGPKAKGALTAAGLPIGWTAPTATSDEVVDHVRGITRPGTRVALQVDGEVGSSFASRFADLDLVVVQPYVWTLPEDTGPARRVATAIAERAVDAVTFTSRPSLENLLTIAEDAGVGARVRANLADRSVRAVCVGPVSAERARAKGIHAIVSPGASRLGAMVRAYVTAVADQAFSLRLGGVDVTLQGRMVRVGDEDPVLLSDRERGLLDELTRKPGAVVSKQALLRAVWGTGEADTHVVEVTMGRLRQRLGQAGVGIETVVRRGYRLSAD